MCELCGVAERDFAHSCNLISVLFREDMLNGRLPTVPLTKRSSRSSSATCNLLPRFCNRLAIIPRYESVARTIIETVFASTAGVVDGRRPVSIAAGKILFLCMLFGSLSLIRCDSRLVHSKFFSDITRLRDTIRAFLLQLSLPPVGIHKPRKLPAQKHNNYLSPRQHSFASTSTSLSKMRCSEIHF